jgi:hypothetical protein
VNERPLDAERIAALLDGRLSPSERQHVISQIADDPTWREALVDAAAVTASPAAEVGADTPDSTRDNESRFMSRDNASRPIDPFRSSGWKPMLLAATLLLAVGLGTWRLASRADVPGERMDVLVVASQSASTLRVENETLKSRWPRVRSASTTLSNNVIGVRAGVLAVDMLATSAQGDNVTLTALRQELLTLLQPVSGSAANVGALRDARVPSELETAFRLVRGLVGATTFDAGAWMELARRSSDSTVRQRAEFREAIVALSEVPGYDEHVRQFTQRLLQRDVRGAGEASTASLLDSLLLATTR